MTVRSANMVWQAYVFGCVEPTIARWCDERSLRVNVFAWESKARAAAWSATSDFRKAWLNCQVLNFGTLDPNVAICRFMKRYKCHSSFAF